MNDSTLARDFASINFPFDRIGAAFTLIELLVVITIVVLLIALLLPAIKRARDSGSNRMIFSQDAGKTWSVPETIPPLPDGRPFHHHGSVVVEGQTVSAIFFARGTDGRRRRAEQIEPC